MHLHTRCVSQMEAVDTAPEDRVQVLLHAFLRHKVKLSLSLKQTSRPRETTKPSRYGFTNVLFSLMEHSWGELTTEDKIPAHSSLSWKWTGFSIEGLDKAKLHFKQRSFLAVMQIPLALSLLEIRVQTCSQAHPAQKLLCLSVDMFCLANWIRM